MRPLTALSSSPIGVESIECFGIMNQRSESDATNLIKNITRKEKMDMDIEGQDLLDVLKQKKLKNFTINDILQLNIDKLKSLQTIYKKVAKLKDAGLVIETGNRPAGRGKPATVYGLA